MAVSNKRPKSSYDNFNITTDVTGYQNIRSYELKAGDTIRFEFQLVGRQTDNGERCTFKRVLLAYKEDASSPVRVVGPTWHTIDTIKSHRSFDFIFQLGTNTIVLQTKNPSNVPVKWVGQVNIIMNK